MSTRSFIGYVNEKKEFEIVYCHFDGYLSNNGKILLENFKTLEKIKELLSYGDMSSLGKSIGSKCDYHNSPPTGVQCIFNNRDEGDELHRMYFTKLEELVKEAWGIDYIYIFKNNKWYTLSHDKEYELLTEERCKK